mgnify:CR=1 FL=1
MYQVYVKSHCEAPDFEAEYTEKELKAGICLIPYDEGLADDDYGYLPIPVQCGGKLFPTVDGFKCKSCKQEYQDIEKQEAIYNDALEASATGN